MGAWGEGLLANDTAGDFTVFWDYQILPLSKTDADYWTPDRIADLLFGFRPFRREARPDADEAAEILAAGALFRRHRWEIPARLWVRLVDAAYTELQSERLDAWSHPAKRKRVLLRFLKAIGADPPPPEEVFGAPPPTTLEDEVEQMRAFIPKLSGYIRVLRYMEEDPEFQRTYPSFIDRITELFQVGDIKIPTQRLQLEARCYRLMCAAWFIGCIVRLPEADILKLIDAAEATEGRVPIMG